VSAGGEADYVVVGGGAAGCVVAARLSESGDRVALLEAGGDDRAFWIRTPLGFGKLYQDARYNWMYEGEAEPGLEGARSFQARGKVLGGTGSINGMIYMRGQREDYDGWRDLGNRGWGYADVLPYFRMSEDNDRGADTFHGSGGPLAVSTLPRHPLADAFVRAGIEAGYPANDDFNGARQEGFGYNQLTTRDGRRCSTTSFLPHAQSRANLRIMLRCLATRVVFESGRAAAVAYRQEGVTRTIRATKEVILCGGVFNSPQLLLLSGVGPARDLRALGIEVTRDAPGVGANLQDHLTVGATYRCTRPITVSDIVGSPVRRALMGMRYLAFHSGLMAINPSYCGGFIRTRPELAHPNVKLNLQLWNRSGFGRGRGGVGLHPESSFCAYVYLLHPDSRGSVRLAGRESERPPSILFNFLDSPADRRCAVDGLRALRHVMAQPAVRPYVDAELTPGAARAGDDDLLAYCRETGRSSHHGVGTCRMGQDRMAVVDDRLRVLGVPRLRVIDASIMPRIVAGNTFAATVMIAEKGACMVSEDARRLS